MLRLNSYLRVPPGSFRYDEPEWGLHVSSNIEQLSEELLDWRKGNNKPRATIDEALQDIEAFTVAGLGNNRSWVHDTDQPFRTRKRSQGCCGAVVE